MSSQVRIQDERSREHSHSEMRTVIRTPIPALTPDLYISTPHKAGCICISTQPQSRPRPSPFLTLQQLNNNPSYPSSSSPPPTPPSTTPVVSHQNNGRKPSHHRHHHHTCLNKPTNPATTWHLPKPCPSPRGNRTPTPTSPYGLDMHTFIQTCSFRCTFSILSLGIDSGSRYSTYAYN